MISRLDLSRRVGRTGVTEIKWDSSGEYLSWDRTSVMVLLPLVRRIDERIPFAVSILRANFPLRERERE